MPDQSPSPSIRIAPFDWGHWPALWVLRTRQLAEDGIVIPLDIPSLHLDVPRDDYEWDYHHIAEIYLRGAGGFWLAWWQGDPAGHVAAQDLGGVVELRHMYVCAEYRRRGIGAALVQALLDHCQAQGTRTVELWTSDDGPGRRLYERMGFSQVSQPGEGYDDLHYRTNFTPGEDEIRMRLEFPENR